MKKLLLVLLLTTAAWAAPAQKATCAPAWLPDSPQPVIQKDFVEFKFFMEITPGTDVPITQHEVDCGEFTIQQDSLFTMAKTILIFGTMQGGSLSFEVELTFPDGTTRTFYQAGEAYERITGLKSANRVGGGVWDTTWPPIAIYARKGTKIHVTFNYAVPDPQHACNPSCIVVGNAWFQGPK